MTDYSHSSTLGPNESNATSLDTAFETLAHPFRRRIVTELVDGGSRPVEGFVRSSGRVDRRTEEIALRHSHLPKLREDGVVEWDRDADVVRRGPRFEAVEAVVELFRSNRDALPGGWP